jgi:hypothetical protein
MVSQGFRVNLSNMFHKSRITSYEYQKGGGDSKNLIRTGEITYGNQNFYLRMEV